MSDDAPYYPMSNSMVRTAVKAGLGAIDQAVDDEGSSSPKVVVKRPLPKQKKPKVGSRESIDAAKEELKQQKKSASERGSPTHTTVGFEEKSDEAPTNTQPLQAQSSAITLSTPTPSPDIPSDIAAGWDRTYHPGLLLLLGTYTASPWDITTQDIAQLFHTTYPTSSYDIFARNNLVLKRSRDRLNNGRSWFPAQAHLVVQGFFSMFVMQYKFAGLKLAAIKQKVIQYFNETVLPEGHMMWSDPQLLPPDAPGYEPATGFCESEFVIGILSTFLQKTAGAAADWRCLSSAVALAGAALEKEFMMYSTGEYVSDGQQFSRDNVVYRPYVGGLVDDYQNNVKNFSICKWDHILKLCGSVPQAGPTSAPSMSTSRRALYVTSSPARGE
ncbi:hypothetical protein B0H16DRAFT_1745259 [Mycena metata]|uniref:Uncharacterized protein n=1 Tax=Mycena metata TaxID=1033252 RepID=A0AAD7H394_9AGAR|nr:hypothetical protein B0H16DRAFT_1745259 [Mycena metata]